MNKKEINEYLSEHLFCLKKGEDFGNKTKHEWVWHHYEKAESECSCNRCNKKYPIEITQNDSRLEINDCYSKEPPDYVLNYQPVLGKLSDIGVQIQIYRAFHDDIPKNYVCKLGKAGTVDAMEGAYTLGEAICACAVEYLEAIKKTE